MKSNALLRLPPGHYDLLEMIQDLLRRVEAGAVLGIALVEHRAGDEVAIEICGPDSYHHLNSGAARLSSFLALQNGVDA